MTAFAPTIYDRAILGEPLPQVVEARPQVETEGKEWWLVDQWQISIPDLLWSPAPEAQRLVAEIRDRTEWSARRLADLVGTSHTTILGIENGRRLMSGRSGDLKRRLSDAHDVVARVFAVANRDPAATTHFLEETPPSGRSAAELLADDEPARAYLAAIDVARPRPPGLLVGTRPRVAGATAALHE